MVRVDIKSYYCRREVDALLSADITVVNYN